MLATEYAEYYKIDPQQEDESDYAFRNRVATELRKMGHIIEAHEARQDERYEQSNDVMTGVIGYIAQALAGTSYGGNQLGNDLVAGGFARYQISPEGQRDEAANAMLADLLASGMSPEDLKNLLG